MNDRFVVQWQGRTISRPLLSEGYAVNLAREIQNGRLSSRGKEDMLDSDEARVYQTCDLTVARVTYLPQFETVLDVSFKIQGK